MLSVSNNSINTSFFQNCLELFENFSKDLQFIFDIKKFKDKKKDYRSEKALFPNSVIPIIYLVPIILIYK